MDQAAEESCVFCDWLKAPPPPAPWWAEMKWKFWKEPWEKEAEAWEAGANPPYSEKPVVCVCVCVCMCVC